jgi:nucleoside-diphosphate-sugar epimerase
MITGSGLIAKSLQPIDTEEILYFASGVSNSLETRSSEFEREFSLLKDNMQSNKDSMLVYFSTLSVNDQSKQSSHYVLHKLQMEDFIKNNSENYLILRIGNIVGNGGNPNTLFNFLRNQITNDLPFVLHKKARRLLIDIDDIPRFFEADYKNFRNQTINFSYPYYYSLKEIVEIMEQQLNKSAIYEEINEGDFYQVDFDQKIDSYFSKVDAIDYLKLMTKKYL